MNGRREGYFPGRRLECTMIVIDAREGVSGDMLLAAMLGLLSADARASALVSLTNACDKRGLTFHLSEIEDCGDAGLGITCLTNVTSAPEASREECISRLAELNSELGSASSVGRRILDHIFQAEAEAHGIAVEQVHLHEIGRTQAMVNISGIGLAESLLDNEGADGYRSSVITTGGGWVVVGHGAIRVPAPASAILLRGLRHQSGDSPGERATPTGIAAIKALAEAQVDPVPDSYKRRSVGFGTKRFAGRLGRTSLLWL